MIETAKNTGAEHYVQRLGLGDDPFAAHFQNDYFYTGGGRQQLLDQLLHYCRFGEQVVLLTGSTGSGTSTILEMLLSELYDQMDCCRVNAEEMLSPDQLLLSLAEQLDFSAPGSIVDLLNDLRHCADHDHDAEPVLIAVDQAQYLSVEGYELLMHLSQSDPGLVHLLFVGEYQVEQLAKLGGFDEADLQLLELEALTEPETAEFLTGLLHSVAYVGEPPLSEDQLSVLYQQSSGNLVEIKRVAPELLGLDAERDAGRFSIPATHMAVVGVLAVLLLLSWFLPDSEPPDDLSGAVQASGQRVSEPIVLDIDRGDRQIPTTAGSDAVNAADTVSDVTAKALPVSKPAVTATAAIKPQPTSVAAQATAPQAVTAKIAVTPSPSVVQAPPPVSPAVPKAAAAKIEPAKAVVEKAVTAKATVPARPPVTPEVPGSAPLASVAADENIPPREQRLLKLAASHYMLQLLGSVDEQRTREFVKQYVGKFALTYFETRRNGSPWFVVVAGPYKDREVAKAAASSLPDKLQQQQPWARSVSSVQADIRANRKR